MEFNNIYDVVIIGGGVIGASIFFHVSQKTSNLCLIESNEIASGCTQYSGGIIRCFHPNEVLIEKAIMSWNYYKNFEKHTGIYCNFNTTGFLFFPKIEDISFAKKSAEKFNPKVPMRWYDEKQLNLQFSNILNTSHYGAIYEPMSGYMDPKSVTKSWVRAAVNNNAQVFEKATFKNLIYKDQKLIGIETTLGTFKGNNIVIATGPQTPFLLDQMNIQHNLYSQVIQVDRRLATTFINNHPAYIDDCYNLNGRPEEFNNIYIGYPTYKRLVYNSDISRQDISHSEIICINGKKRWRWVDKSILIDSLCSADCYNTEGDGVVSNLKEKNLYLATGFSGGGFKIAPWVGREIVKLIGF